WLRYSDLLNETFVRGSRLTSHFVNMTNLPETGSVAAPRLGSNQGTTYPQKSLTAVLSRSQCILHRLNSVHGGSCFQGGRIKVCGRSPMSLPISSFLALDIALFTEPCLGSFESM